MSRTSLTEDDLKAKGFVKTAGGWTKKPSLVAKKAVKVNARVSTRQRHESGKMNKLEAEYAKHLELRLMSGDIARWDFEPLKLRLANRTFYEPDFRVILLDGTEELHEVKGYWEDDARVKIKVAAEMHPYSFVAIQKVKGEWVYELFSR